MYKAAFLSFSTLLPDRSSKRAMWFYYFYLFTNLQPFKIYNDHEEPFKYTCGKNGTATISH